MTKSPTTFDQKAFSIEAKQAFHGGCFIDWLSKSQYNIDHQYHNSICKVLVELHNTQEIDLLKLINTGQLENRLGNEFWHIQGLYCTLIPELETPADPLMEAVLRLVKQGGNDLAANFPNGAFRDWLKRHPEETKRLLHRAQQCSEPGVSVLTFVLEAGATHNLAEYHSAALRFLDDDHLENRLAGVTALGRIDTETDEDCHLKSLESLSEHAIKAETDQEAAQTVGALLNVYARHSDVEKDRVIATIEVVAKRPTTDLHYLLSQSLGQNHEKFSNELQIAIIDALQRADPSMKGVVDQIDFAFAQCLNDENQEAIADCLQALLDHPESPLNLADLDSFIHRLVTKRPKSLSWLVIRWLRFGSHRARLSLPSLFRHFTDDGYELKLAPQNFSFSDKELLFISRKALGYFLLQAATAASILILCLRASSSNQTAEAISQLLFDPLMINFSGQARSVVERQAKTGGKKQQYLRDALKAHDDYLAGLSSVGKIPELWPSASERQMQAERQRQQFARSFKEAEKLSVIANLVTKQTLLHGLGSVYYMRTPDGLLQRSESLLSSHEASMEFPRFEAIDPVHLRNLIMRFRNEALDP